MADVSVAASGRPHIRPTYGLHMGVAGQLGCLGCVWGSRLGGFFLSGQAARAFGADVGCLVVDALSGSRRVYPIIQVLPHDVVFGLLVKVEVMHKHPKSEEPPDVVNRDNGGGIDL